MTIKTKQLDEAAFYTTFGAQITHITGHCPDNEFTIETSRWLFIYQQLGGWAPYNKFCNERRKIKKITRKMAGLPEYFTGHTPTGFKLLDIATVKPFSEKEKDKFEDIEIRRRWEENYKKIRGL